jgi:hypothetical protein
VGEITRLGFMKNTAGAAAGMTVIGSIVATKADAKGALAGAEPVVAYVKDPSTGEIALMTGEREVIVHDRALAARLSHAAAG